MGELQSWFATDDDCVDYLEWLRWPDGFVCPACGQPGGWRLGDGRLRCGSCRPATSVTAGTIFDKTRTPLTLWFMACWLFATQKDGVSAQSLQRALEISSYQTAWATLHRPRSVLVRPGRCRMAILPDASAASLHPFVTGHVAPGATVVSDAWPGYSGALPRPRHRPATQAEPASRTGRLGSPSVARAAAGEPPVASSLTSTGPAEWIPHRNLSRGQQCQACPTDRSAPMGPLGRKVVAGRHAIPEQAAWRRTRRGRESDRRP